MDPPRPALCRPDEGDGEACRRPGVFTTQQSQAGGLASLRKATLRQKQEINSAGQCAVFPEAEGNCPGVGGSLAGACLGTRCSVSQLLPPSNLQSSSALMGTGTLPGHCPCLELAVLPGDGSVLSSA